MKPIVSTLNHENSFDPKLASITSDISQDPSNTKSSTTADELKAKLRAWHSRFKNEKANFGDKTNSIEQQSVKTNQRQHNKGVMPDSTLPNVTSRDTTNGTSLSEISSRNGSKSLNGHSQRHLPETSKDKTFDKSKVNGTDHSMKTADFTGPLSLSEILKRKKSTSTPQKKSKPPNGEINEKQRVHSFHSPSSLREVTGLGKRQMTSKDGQYVVSQSDKSLNKNDTGDIQPRIKSPVTKTLLQVTPNTLVLPKPSSTSPAATSTSVNAFSSNKKTTENRLETGDLKQVEKKTVIYLPEEIGNDVSKPLPVENVTFHESLETITTDSHHSNTPAVEPFVLPLPSSSDQMSCQSSPLQPLTLPKIMPAKLFSPQTTSHTISAPMVSFQTKITPIPPFTSTRENVDKHVLNTTTPPLVIATALHTSSIDNFTQTSNSSSLSDSQVVLKASSSLKPVQSFIQHFSLQSTNIPASTVQEICPVSVLSKTVQSFTSEAITPLLLKPNSELPFQTQDVTTLNPTLLEKTDTLQHEKNTVNVVSMNDNSSDKTVKAKLVATPLLENTLVQKKTEPCLQNLSLTSSVEQQNLPMVPTSTLSPNTCLSDSHSSSTSSSPKLTNTQSQINKHCLLNKSNIESVPKRTATPHPFATTLLFQEQDSSNTFSNSSTFLDKASLNKTLECNTTVPCVVSKSTDFESHLVSNMEQMTEHEYQLKKAPLTLETLHDSSNVFPQLDENTAVNMLDVTSLHPLVRTMITATGPKTMQHYMTVMNRIAEQTTSEQFQCIQQSITQPKASLSKTLYTSTEQSPKPNKHIQLANSVLNVLNSIILDCVASPNGTS